jgi:hypothetical protein
MAVDFRDDVQLNKNAIIQAVMHPVGSDPSSPVDGQMWYRTDTDTLYVRANGVSEAISTSAGGISNIVEDATPQLGGMLDVLNEAIGDGTRELITFVKDPSAVNQLEIENEATGSGPILRATGDDVNVDMEFQTKGSGAFNFTGSIAVTGTVDGRDVLDDGEAGDNLITLSGVARDDTHLGTFTGTTISDSVALKVALQELETAVEAISTPPASETTAGIAELATQAETDAGTDDLRIVTPLKLDGYDPTLASWFTDDDTGAAWTAANVASGESIAAYIATQIAGFGRYQGGYNAATDTPSLDDGTPVAGIQAGDSYTVTVAGTFFTIAVEVGDLLIAEIDSALVEADWTVVNRNLDQATRTESGIAEIATEAEIDTGTDDTRMITPSPSWPRRVRPIQVPTIYESLRRSSWLRRPTCSQHISTPS